MITRGWLSKFNFQGKPRQCAKPGLNVVHVKDLNKVVRIQRASLLIRHENSLLQNWTESDWIAFVDFTCNQDQRFRFRFLAPMEQVLQLCRLVPLQTFY